MTHGEKELHWNKPERVNLAPGMFVSYHNVGLWSILGEISQVSGSSISVRWPRVGIVKESAGELLVWSEIATDERDVYVAE